MELKFWNSENKLNPDLFSGVADQWARTICEAGLKRGRGGNRLDKIETNKITQIRKFYDEALRFHDLIKSGEDIENVLPYIKMLNAKAAYAEGRKLITAEFKNLIKQATHHISKDNPQSFEVFISFFEAFMGYYKYYESKYKNA